MCYSKEVSRDSYIINIITCYILYYYHSNNSTYKIFALFFAFVGLMQLFDWIFWEHQDMSSDNDKKINFIFTKIAMFANHLQPIVLAYLIYHYYGKLKDVSLVILILYIIFIIPYTINAYNQIDYTLQQKINVIDLKEPKPSLYWQWNSKYNSFIVYALFLIALSIFSLENFSYPMNIIFAFINVFTFFLSDYYYKGHSTGRFWCKNASLVPLLILILGELKLITY